VLSGVLRAGRASTAGLSPLSTPDSILMCNGTCYIICPLLPQVYIDRFFPSTKLCHVCGTLNAFITLRDRVWTCACGTIHQRDRHAARNIYREVASSHAQGRCKTTSVAATA